MPETFTREEIRIIEDLQGLEAAINRLVQVQENPLVLNCVRRVHADLAMKNRDLIKRYTDDMEKVG